MKSFYRYHQVSLLSALFVLSSRGAVESVEKRVKETGREVEETSGAIKDAAEQVSDSAENLSHSAEEISNAAQRVADWFDNPTTSPSPFIERTRLMSGPTGSSYFPNLSLFWSWFKPSQLPSNQASSQLSE